MKSKLIAVFLVFMVASAGYSLAADWFTYRSDASGLANDVVKAVCVDGLGAKWFGTADGLSRFDGSTWSSFGTSDSLAHESVRDIAFELTSYGPEIWVGTEGGVSVVNVTPDAITFATPYRTANTGLIDDSVNAAAVDSNHVKWFGTDNGLSSFDGDTWTQYDVWNLLSENHVLSIDVGLDGWIYFGTNGGGINRFDGVTSASPWDTQWTNLPSDAVTAIHIAPDGIQWFGTDKGLASHTGMDAKNDWTVYTAETGELPGNFVHAVQSDLNGVVWVGTSAGLARFDGDGWETFTTADGLAGDAVYDIAVDVDNSLWIGTNAGVSHYIGDPVSVEESAERPGPERIMGAFPNPFNPRTSIKLQLPESGVAEVSVFNLAGQKVRTLVSGEMAAGTHSILWDGCDDAGNRLSSGVYISRLEFDGRVQTGKMMLVK